MKEQQDSKRFGVLLIGATRLQDSPWLELSPKSCSATSSGEVSWEVHINNCMEEGSKSFSKTWRGLY